MLVRGPDLDRRVRGLGLCLGDGLLQLFLNASRCSGVAEAGWRGRGFCTDQSIALSASQPRWGKTAAREQLLDPARHEARHRRDVRDRVTPRQKPDHLKVPRRRRIPGRPEPRFQILDAQMTRNPRHSLPPRLMAHQPTRFATAQESKPSPSPGIRIRLLNPDSPDWLSFG